MKEDKDEDEEEDEDEMATNCSTRKEHFISWFKS
jgi:hypothetical protein